MRSIKFRSWNGKNFEYFNNGKCDCAFGWGEAQQFTGLVDKHGVEIYEGDLIQLGKINGLIYQVVYLNSAYGFVDVKSGDFWHYTCNLATSSFGEVIGNIYEHSHLLDS